MKQWEFDERWKQGMRDLAEEEEQRCGDWENSEGLSEEARRDLFAKIEEKEVESAKLRPFRMKKRYIPVLAAALVLLFGMGAVGERVWRSENNDFEREMGVTTKVNNETKESTLLETDEVYEEIKEKLGIAVLRMEYMPEGTILDRVRIRESLGWAKLYYLCDENMISLEMSKKSQEASANIQWEGNFRKLEVASQKFYEYEIEAYCMDEEEHFYGANILYGNGYYSISGKFEDENEFLQILEKIYFN